MAEPTSDRKRSLFQLFSDVPVLVKELVRGELELFKQEMIAKLKALGIGGGLIFGAVIVLLFFIGTLLTAAILGLGQVMPPWLAALVVSFVLLVVAGIIGLVGYRKLKAGIPPIPSDTIAGLKKDLNVVKGIGPKNSEKKASK